MKSILVLEGGGLRGIYTAGVLDILLENNIKVDAIVGVSAGALFGVNYKSKQPGRCIRYNLANINNKEYMGFSSLIRTGNIMNKEFCFNKLIRETDPFDFKTFKESKVKFYAVVTNLETGKAEYKLLEDLDNENEIEYLRASGSMPLVSKNVLVKGKNYLDGAIGDSIPLEWAEKQGYNRIIVVETRTKEYRKDPTFMIPYEIRYKKFPKFIESIKKRPEMYNAEKEYIEEQNKKKKILVVRPSNILKIKRVEKDKSKIQAMYDLGREDTLAMLEEIKKYLK